MTASVKFFHPGTAVILPSLRISSGEIDDGGAFSVHSHCLGPYARCFGEPIAVVLYAEGVGICRTAFPAMMPTPGAGGRIEFHGEGRVWLAGVAVVVQVDYGLLGFRAPQSERGAAVVDGQFKIIRRCVRAGK